MYLIDFAKSLVKRGNVSIIIYLCVNVIIIIGLSASMLQEIFGTTAGGAALSVLVGILIYVISLAIALSPIGESVLRLQLGCKELSDPDQIAQIEPLFREVYAKAKANDPSLSDDIKIFINHDDTVNAFATGRKTICVNRGMLRVPPEQIKATLAHEFGHIAHKDTDLILIISVGNFIITALMTVIKVVTFLISAFIGGIFRCYGLLTFISLAIFNAMMWVWTKFGTLLVLKASRGNEYLADEFSYKNGYGESLCAFLDTYARSDFDSARKGLFAALSQSHPDTDDRIAKIRSYGPLQIMPNHMKDFADEKPEDMPMPSEPATPVNALPVRVCTNCGAEIKRANARFCTKCGMRIRKDA